MIWGTLLSQESRVKKLFYFMEVKSGGEAEEDKESESR